MRRPWSALVLAAGGLLLLVSLYLPWAAPSANAEGGGFFSGALHLFGVEDVSAWSATASTACAVCALYLVAAAVIVWMRAPARIRIPISAPALLAAYLALSIAIEARKAAMTLHGGFQTIDLHYARGAYLGMAAGVLTVGAAAALRRSTPRRVQRPPALGLLGVGLATALLGVLLLPWERATINFEGGSASVEYPGISEPASIVVSLAAVWLAAMSWSDRADAGWKRGVLASAIALFTIGALSAADPVLQRTYEAWIALGIALALLLLTVLRARVRLAWVKGLGWRELALAAAAALFLGSLFLPWREEHFPSSFAPDPHAGHSVTLNAWTLTGTAAASLALGLLVCAIRRLRYPVHPFSLAAGTALFAVAAAAELKNGSTRQVPIELSYGAFVGLACAGVATVLALPQVTRPEWREIVPRSIPIVLCLGYLAIVIVPPLSDDQLERPTFFFAPTSWLTIAGAVVAIVLAQSWVEQRVDRAWLVALPLGMLALALVDVVRLRHDLAWGAAVVVGLCIVLSGLGRIEQRGGLSGLRVPDALRLDRI